MNDTRPLHPTPETPFGARLRAARKMAGMSMEDLAAKLGGLVTKQAISKYEQGRMMPSPQVLEKLVEILEIATWGSSPLRSADRELSEARLGESQALFSLEALERPTFRRAGLLGRLRKMGPEAGELGPLEKIRFRAGERLPSKTEAALKYRIAAYLEKYLELESILGQPALFENPLADRPPRSREEVESAARRTRECWGLGGGPIVNLLDLLEDKGVKIYETRGLEGFDGLSGRYGDAVFMAVSLDFPADRIRFTAAHELGHLLCDFEAAGNESPESECHAFGAAFLLPRPALEKVFTPSRRKVTLGDLAEIKEAYGISLQAVMYRAHDLGLVTGRQLRSFRETFKERNWLVVEPASYEGRERATRFRRLLRYAVAADILNIDRAAELAGVTTDALQKEIGDIF